MSSSEPESSQTPEPLQSVRLKNGQEVPRAAVIVTMVALESLAQSDPIGFYELAQKARDPEHQFFADYETSLKGLAMLQEDGTMHDVTRDVVLSATEGEDLDVRLVSPVA